MPVDFAKAFGEVVLAEDRNVEVARLSVFVPVDFAKAFGEVVLAEDRNFALGDVFGGLILPEDAGFGVTSGRS